MIDETSMTDAGPAPEGLVVEVEESMIPDEEEEAPQASALDAEDAGPPAPDLVAEIEGHFEPDDDPDDAGEAPANP
jgi:hypothetical protein